MLRNFLQRFFVGFLDGKIQQNLVFFNLLCQFFKALNFA
jgi:hypothetical protein